MQNVVKQAFTEKTASGTELTIDNTIEARMDLKLKGNTSQNTTTGKNLLPINAVTETIKGVTLTPEYTQNGELKYLKINGTATSAITFNHSMNKDIKKGNYIFSVSDTELPFVFGIEITGETTFFPNTKKSWTFNNSSDKKITKWFINIPAGTYNDIKVYPMLRLQSITDATYEPYTNGVSPNPDYPQEIQSVTGNNKVVVSNKNLLNIEDRTYTYNGISAKVENGTFIINGTPSGSTSFLNFSNITLKAGTYTISANNTLKLTNESDFRITNSNGTTIFARLYLSSENAKLTFTLNKDLVNGTFQLRTGTSITYNNFVIKPQLEQGSTATSYVPHKGKELPLDLGNIELCKIGDYQDYFYKSGSKWYLHKEIGKVVLDGSERWDTNSYDANFYRYVLTINDSKVTSNTGTDVLALSNYFNSVTSNDVVYTHDKDMIGIISSNRIAVSTINSNLFILNNFKIWLSTHNTSVYYIKENSTNIEITDTTLITQLNEISQALSQKGTTIISQSNDDLPFNLDVIALTK